MSWAEVGSVNVGPQDREVLVGSFSMEPEEDTIWFRVTQTSPEDCWNYAFGLLTWRTSFGQELGTEKVYGDIRGEVFQLGVGLPPLERTGSVYFTPRAYNRRWISIADPPTWSLTFEAQSGFASSGGAPAFGTRATLTTIADLAGKTLEFLIESGLAKVVLSY